MVKVREDLPRTHEGSIDLAQWLSRITNDRSHAGKQLIQHASELALEYGAHVITPVKESCFRQGLVSAEILSHLDPDAETICAAIVYFPYRYGKLPLEEISKVLNADIAILVEGVAKIDATTKRSGNVTDLADKHQQRDNLRRMLLAVVEDVRVVLIKLAEKISNLRASIHLDDKARELMAIETRDIYAPLANRLGIGQIKWELEDFAFRFLEPVAYKKIAKLLDEKRVAREQYIERVTRELKHAIEKEGVKCEVLGRAKHIYSIWRKMIRKDIDFKDIYDVRAMRVLVGRISDCYAALGVVHTLWQPIPHEFDDYIATPKENGYRSLHTAVVGPDGKPIEVQIRTYEMHQESELGVAAHWIYKEGGKTDPTYHKKIVALRQILDWDAQIAPTESTAENTLASELFEDRVYVFTPHGEVVDLPQGATPLDFAYYVHTEIGHRCRGAKINGQMVPLNTPLQSGDQIEILTIKEGGPSRDWLRPDLGYLISARAKAKILVWFRKQNRDKNIVDGRAILEKELKKLGLSDQLGLIKIANQLHYKTIEDMYAAIGGGELKLSQIINALSPAQLSQHDEDIVPIVSPHKRHPKPSSEIIIEGIGDLMYHYAQCCKPLPGDPIVGYITLGRGVTIHRQDCLNVLHLPEDYDNRLIQVNWGDTRSAAYPVDIEIEAYDRQGLLRDITNIMTQEKVNITKMNTFTDKNDNCARFFITLEISDLEGLAKILNKLTQLPNVLRANRLRSNLKKG